LRVPSATLTEELDARAVKAVLGRASVGVGTANHFCVFAASMGTPVVGVYATPYMEQKLVGLAKLWPDRVTALAKEAGLNPSVMSAAGRRFVEDQLGRPGEPPAVKVQSDAAARLLSRRLETLGSGRARPYSARYVEVASVETYEREFGPGEFMTNVSMLERASVRSALRAYGRDSFARHLDFACGTGRATGYVDGFARSTVGVDISDSMLDRARAKFPAARFSRVDVVADPVVLEHLGPFERSGDSWRQQSPICGESHLQQLRGRCRKERCYS
jgi:hypothetical protein